MKMNITVDLHDFNDEIIEYAEEHLDMIYIDNITLEYLHEKYDIHEFLKVLGDVSFTNLHYPNNSIVTTSIYKRLNENVGKIPLKELEELLDKYNCI